MRKNNTDKLFTSGFSRMCLSNFLFYASVYLLLPLLPMWLMDEKGFSGSQVAMQMVAAGAGMLLVGPFHAYLGDTYKRKYVLMAGVVAVALALLAMLYAEGFAQWVGLVAQLGGGLGVASPAGFAVAIDITASSRRSSGNEAYAWAGRAGMLVGVLAGVALFPWAGWNRLIYLAVGLDVLALLVSARVYVAFRAPIGLPLLSFDRFFLPRAWLPFLNLCLLAFAAGVQLPLLQGWGSLWPLLPLLLLTLGATYFTQLFVGLSQHCQRSTANTTCHMAIDLGALAGLSIYALYVGDKDSFFFIEAGLLAAGAALLGYLLATLPYYNKKRVR